jgi:hypothetical protein
MAAVSVAAGTAALVVSRQWTASGSSLTAGTVTASPAVQISFTAQGQSQTSGTIKTKANVANILWAIPTKYTAKKWSGSAWVVSPLERPLSYAPTGSWSTEKVWNGTEWVATLPSKTPAEPSGTWAVKRKWNGTEWEVLSREWVS